MTTDKESFVCLNCYFVGPLDVHGRCVKCSSDVVASVEAIKALDSPEKRADAQYHASKSLRWWHFVWGPFEAYVSNYRCTNVEEARHEVSHDNYAWTLRCDISDMKGFNDQVAVEDLSNEEYNTKWREGNARKSEYYQIPSGVNSDIVINSDSNTTKEVSNEQLNTGSGEATS